MPKYKNKIVYILGFVFSIILVLFFDDIVLITTGFAEKYISQDNNIESAGIGLIKTNLVMLISLILILSISLAFNFFKIARQFITPFVDLKSIITFVLADSVCSKKQIPVYIFIISTTSSLFLHYYLILVGEPAAEGFLETYTSSLFLISGIILLISNLLINKNQFPAHIKKKLILILTSIALIFIFIFAEEISWGQRIFNLDSFGVFSDYNYQNEINYHNFFNPLFPIIYPIFGLSFFIVLLSLWFFPKNRSFLYQLTVPPPSFIYIALTMAGAAFRGHSEIFEELLAISSLLYSTRVFICLNYPKNK